MLEEWVSRRERSLTSGDGRRGIRNWRASQKAAGVLCESGQHTQKTAEELMKEGFPGRPGGSAG